MTTNETKCGKGEITIDGATTNVDFTVDICANLLNREIPDHTLWHPPIFNGCIHSMPVWVFEALKDEPNTFKIAGEVQKGVILTIDNCKVSHIKDSYEVCGACISCDISFNIRDLNSDMRFEHSVECGVDKE